MLPDYLKVKGIHPGAILKRELSKQKLKAIDLAKSIDEYPQTINAITKEKRGINPKVSIKLGIFFNVEEDYFMILQASHEVKKNLQKENLDPFKGKIRASIFWDTKVDSIDLTKNRRSIIQRILERGNKTEINELIYIYSLPTIKKEIQNIKESFNPNYKRNVDKYIYNRLVNE